MVPERQRRFMLLALVCVLMVVVSWLEHQIEHMTGDPSEAAQASPALHRPPYLTKKSGKKVGKGEGEREEGTKGRKGDQGGRNDDDDDDDGGDDAMAYFKVLKEKSRLMDKSISLHLDLHACLPRFICELHAQAPGAALTDFEKDVLGLFRNHVVLEGPGSPVYPYQVAAHMGQLCTGLDPSPCHSLYPSCPLSRTLLIELLRSVKTSRRMFY